MKTLTQTHGLLLAAATLVAIATTQPAHAASTVAVGTCHAPTPHSPTIQQAVSAVDSGGTVLICPNTYAEQVAITQPLTLKGLAVGKLQAPSIIKPYSGLSVNYISPSLSSVAPHILVQNAGTVTISNVDVEGLGANCDTHYAEVGILSSNSNTTVTSSVVRHMSTSDFPCYGVGIYAELADNLFVQNSTVRGFDYRVETIYANATTLSGNLFGDGANAINITDPAGISTISANTLEGIGCHTGCDGTSGQGIALLNALPGSKVLTNQISVTQKSQNALLLIGNATVTGNKISVV